MKVQTPWYISAVSAAYTSPVLLVDLAMVSWKYQFVAESNNIRAMRYRMGNVRLRIYAHASRPRPIFVCIYSHASRPSPRWFVLHPMQRRFKPVHSSQCRINQYNSSRTWEFLFLFTPKMPLNIQQRVVINGQIIYGVDEDGQIFYFTPTRRPQQGLLELWYAEISMKRCQGDEGWWEVWGNIECSAPVLSDSSHSALNLLHAAT
uniref:Uncharacterized protein n=2 Tax=Brassica oleracea TaxID=3712 RepID=A0A0D3CQE0_BRAOL